MASNEISIKSVLQKHGFIQTKKLAQTLQGEIWQSDNQVIKVTSKTLHNKSIVILDGKEVKINEDILTEKQVLQYLNSFTDCPKSIIEYKNFFESSEHFFLSLEHGGGSLFDFVFKAHKLIQQNQLDVSEWTRIVKCIFKQMINAIEYMHSKNICHFDISLENTLINDIDVYIYKNKKLKFIGEPCIKIIDFGLSQFMFHKIDKDTKYKPSLIDDKFMSTKFCGKTNYQSPEVFAQTKAFDPVKNDIWCLGTCLWMMCIGCAPYSKPHLSDKSFSLIMNGYMQFLLMHWKSIHYVDRYSFDLITSIFQYENQRISLKDIKNHPWLQ